MAGIFDTGIFDPGIFDELSGGAFQNTAFQNDAFQTDPSATVFTLDAILRRSVSSSFALDAVLFQHSLTLDAAIKRSASSSLAFDAVLTNETVHLVQAADPGPVAHAVTVTLPAAATAGNLLVAYGTTRSGSFDSTPSGFISPYGNVNPNGLSCWMGYKVAVAGDQSFFFDGTGNITEVWVGEFSGVNAATILTDQTTGFGSHAQGSAIASGGTHVLYVSGITTGHETWVPATPDAGQVEDQDTAPSNQWPTLYVTHRILHPAVGSYQLGATGQNNQNWIVTTFAFASNATSFTLNAVIAPVVGGTFTLDAIRRKSVSSTFTLDAVLLKGFRLNAVIRKAGSGSFTLNAVIRARFPFFINAWIKGRTTSSFTLDAVILVAFRVNRSFTLNSVIYGTSTFSFTLNAWIKNGSTGLTGEPGIKIRVNHIDVTSAVIFQDAEFTMLVNGAAGTFSFRIRDIPHAHDFTTGQEVTVDIDGYRKFGGFLTGAHRTFAFPYDLTTDPTTTERLWTLTGVDYNILFAKRIVYDKVNPNNVNLRSWPTGSDDDVVIKYTFDHYTDLGLDGVVYDGVTHVGTPNPDYKGVIASGGLTFGDAMTEINRLINGVFYINPYKVLCFVDVDTPDAAHSFSDHPGGGSEVGYREFTQTENGTRLINDALVWGAGSGSNRIVFSRTQDTTSQTTHGLWQYGEFTSQLYKQQSVDKRSHSIVYGSVQSKRGAKDDQIGWEVKTFDTTFNVGEKVQIESEVWGVSDVVPIRRMTLTFPTPTDPKMQLSISHEIDEPWNMFEFPPFPRPNFNFQVRPFPPIGGCTTGTCGIGQSTGVVFDNFTRLIDGPTWGHPSSDPPHDWLDNGDATVGTSGGFGFADLVGDGDDMDEIYQDIGNVSLPWSDEFTVQIDFIHDGLDSESFVEYFLAVIDNNTGETVNAFVYMSNQTGDQSTISHKGQLSSTTLFVEEVNIDASAAGVVTHMKWHFNPGVLSEVKFWADPDPEPDWMSTADASLTTPSGDKRLRVNSDSNFPVHVDFDNLTFGDTGTVIDPACFDATQAHYMYINFTFLTDGCGDSRGPGHGQTVFSQYTNLASFPVGTDWQYAMGLVVSNTDYAFDWGLGLAGGPTDHSLAGWGPLHIDPINTLDGYVAIGGSGNFHVYPGWEGLWAAAATGAAGGHVPHTANVTGWIDPLSGPLVQPAPCQTVYDKPVPVTSTPSGFEFKTSFPYQAGSLRVFVNGTEITTFIEVDPANGLFTITSTISATDLVETTYTASGTAPSPSESGDLRTDLPGGGTVFTLPGSYQLGSTQVFLDGYFQRPGHEYTETDPDGGVITFASSTSSTDVISVFYIGTGPKP